MINLLFSPLSRTLEKNITFWVLDDKKAEWRKNILPNIFDNMTMMSVRFKLTDWMSTRIAHENFAKIWTANGEDELMTVQ
jgi:hypothetical protein